MQVRIQDGDDFLELTVHERCEVVHGLGDTEFAVRVRVSGLNTVITAHSRCWVDLQSLSTFSEQLRELEEWRRGSATLESMSPGELRIEIRTDRIGHVEAIGHVGRKLGVGTGEPYWSTVAFRIPFYASELPALVQEFSALVDPANLPEQLQSS